MTILVTGGCGLVGSFAVRHAAEHGQRVVAFDLALKTELLQDVLDRVTLVKGDVLNMPELMDTVNRHGVTRILHSASFLTPGAYERPYPAIQLTVMGTLNVLECARILGLERVVYVSTGKTMVTGKAFAQAAGKGELDIDADPYTSAKIAAELICNDYYRKYGMNAVIARPCGQIYGPGFAFTGALGQGLQDLVEKPVRGEPVKLDKSVLAFSMPVMSMLYAGDCGRGLMMLTMKDGIKNHVHNIVALENASLWEIAGIIRELIPGAKIEVPSGPPKGGPVTVNQLAKEDFGYVPEYGTRRGLQEYIEFLRTGKYRKIDPHQ